MFGRYRHEGYTLDLGCGTGIVGKLIHDNEMNDESEIYLHGIDISERMLQSPWVQELYDSKEQRWINLSMLDPDADWAQKAHDFNRNNPRYVCDGGDIAKDLPPRVFTPED
jgi:ubiquinone/menaquinone biosynthesis C-methylase UbiE